MLKRRMIWLYRSHALLGCNRDLSEAITPMDSELGMPMASYRQSITDYSRGSGVLNPASRMLVNW
jgi:hypothetical protein